MKINERFSIERDKLNFIVVETVPKKKLPKGQDVTNETSEKRSFHPSLEVACNYVVKQSTEVSGDLTKVLLTINYAKYEIVSAIDRMEKRL